MESEVIPLNANSEFLQDLENDPPDGMRDHRLYVNRELAQLEFQKRVLSMATDPATPLLEQLRFLSISRALLDEFFEVRVAALKQRIQHGAARPGPDGLTPLATLMQIRESALEIVTEQYRIYRKELKPQLQDVGVRFIQPADWSEDQTLWLHEYLKSEVMPILSPLGLDPAHPFPRILTKSLNFLVQLRGRDAFGREGSMALVRAPRSLPRLIQIPRPNSDGQHDFVFLSSLLQHFMSELFPGMSVVGSHQFRVTRDSELLVDEEEVEDLASALRSELMERGYAEAVRLEVRPGCPPAVEKYLSARFNLEPEDLYYCDGPVNLYRLTEIIDQVDRPDLLFPTHLPHTPRQLVGKPRLFGEIRRGDILLHHPYESFSPLIELLRQSARDPKVLAIKQTLYRTGLDSQVVNHLVEAARAGKDVTAIVELRARFDEEANLNLATRLQEAGVQVVYGIVGHKAHAKMLMIIRRERGIIRRYVHLGTGNYHSGTSKLYTDIGLLTCHPDIGEDVQHVFQQLSGLGRVMKMKQLLNSPFTLHKAILDKIARETENARAGKPAAIDAKLNALTEPKIIRALYEASQAGVPVRLIIRGTCCLRPGIPGLSENIRVRSLLGRFLEHARVYSFANDGDPEVWCSSADWMERNLFQRVEIAFPILVDNLKNRVLDETIELAWRNNVLAWDMQPDGVYRPTPVRKGKKQHHPQKKLQKMIVS